MRTARAALASADELSALPIINVRSSSTTPPPAKNSAASFAGKSTERASMFTAATVGPSRSPPRVHRRSTHQSASRPAQDHRHLHQSCGEVDSECLRGSILLFLEAASRSLLVVAITTAINARRSHMDDYLLLVFAARASNYLQWHVGNTKSGNLHN